MTGPRCLCGSEGRTVIRPRKISLSRWSAIVDDEFYRCENCGEEWYAPGQMQVTQERAAKLIRQNHGLVSPERIRFLRSRYGITQSQLERMLGVGPKTVIRWEKGSVVPTLAANRLLELLEKMPAVAELLAEEHGVILRPVHHHVSLPSNQFSLVLKQANVYLPTADSEEPKEAVA